MKISQPIHALKELSEIIALGAFLDDVFDTALEQIVLFMEADGGSIQLLEEQDTLRTVAVYGEVAHRLYDTTTHFTIAESGLQRILKSNQAHVIHNMTDSLDMTSQLSALLREERLTTGIFVSLKVKGQIIGALSVVFKIPPVIPTSKLAWFEVMTILISISLYNARLLSDLNTKQAELQNAWKAVTDAQEMERKRLSRELHDDVGQALTSLMLRLKTLQTETDLDTISDRLNGLRYLTGQTLEEVRRISADLRPVVFDELGLIPAIRSYVNERSAWSKIDIMFRTAGDVYALRPELEIACYRTIQEGLTNIIRHAQASQAVIELAYSSETVQLTISDNGIGMRYPLETKGVGLLGMQERVRLIGGKISIVNEPGAGLTLIINFPRSA